MVIIKIGDIHDVDPATMIRIQLHSSSTNTNSSSSSPSSDSSSSSSSSSSPPKSGVVIPVIRYEIRHPHGMNSNNSNDRTPANQLLKGITCLGAVKSSSLVWLILSSSCSQYYDDDRSLWRTLNPNVNHKRFDDTTSLTLVTLTNKQQYVYCHGGANGSATRMVQCLDLGRGQYLPPLTLTHSRHQVQFHQYYDNIESKHWLLILSSGRQQVEMIDISIDNSDGEVCHDVYDAPFEIPQLTSSPYSSGVDGICSTIVNNRELIIVPRSSRLPRFGLQSYGGFDNDGNGEDSEGEWGTPSVRHCFSLDLSTVDWSTRQISSSSSPSSSSPISTSSTSGGSTSSMSACSRDRSYEWSRYWRVVSSSPPFTRHLFTIDGY